MVTNAAWVCFECRRAVRRPKQHEAERARQNARDEDAQRAAVRARHDLEQEIRRLEALPQSPGRTRSIKLLRKRLESPPG